MTSRRPVMMYGSAPGQITLRNRVASSAPMTVAARSQSGLTARTPVHTL